MEVDLSGSTRGDGQAAGASLPAQAVVDGVEVGLARPRPRGVLDLEPLVLAVAVTFVHEPAAPPAVLAAVRPPPGERFEGPLPDPDSRPADVDRSAMGTLHHW